MNFIDLRAHVEHNDGYAWILNIMDCYSKFILPVPLKHKTASNVLKLLNTDVQQRGYPMIVQTDNGLEFNNELLKFFLIEKNIQFKRGRPRHPQNQGQIERANQTSMRKIAKCLSNNTQKDRLMF